MGIRDAADALDRRYVAARAVAMQDRGEAADLGCGPGQLVAEMARKAPLLHLTGIDLSEKMLEDARGSARQAGLADQVEFRLGDVEEIPFPDRSLDLVVSTLSLHHWDDPVKVLNEIERVLNRAALSSSLTCAATWPRHFTC